MRKKENAFAGILKSKITYSYTAGITSLLYRVSRKIGRLSKSKAGVTVLDCRVNRNERDETSVCTLLLDHQDVFNNSISPYACSIRQ
jgi:hypothetical protein